MSLVGYRLHAMSVPDDAALPRVAYLVPVDEKGAKCGETVVGTLSRTRAADMVQGQVFKARPTLGVYTRPVREPDPAPAAAPAAGPAA